MKLIRPQFTNARNWKGPHNGLVLWVQWVQGTARSIWSPFQLHQMRQPARKSMNMCLPSRDPVPCFGTQKSHGLKNLGEKPRDCDRTEQPGYPEEGFRRPRGDGTSSLHIIPSLGLYPDSSFLQERIS